VSKFWYTDGHGAISEIGIVGRSSWSSPLLLMVRKFGSLRNVYG